MSRKKEVIVSDVSKKHDNPIAELVQVACCFDSEIILESNNRKINAKSIMGIMAFNPTVGHVGRHRSRRKGRRRSITGNGKIFGL